MSMPSASVVIPTYRRAALLRRLLAALTRQTVAPARFDVVVVVDGSDDGTCEMLAAAKTPYVLRWRWRPNGGRASACNAGVALARGDLIVLLDDDMEPSPVLLEAHMAAHRPGGRRAVIGAAPIVLAEPACAAARYAAQKFNRHLERLATPGHVPGLRGFYSGNLSIPRAVLVSVGAFDEDFRTYGNEDVELSWRLRQAGVEVVFNRAAIAHQRYDKDFRALARDNVSKGETAVMMAAKHPPARRELKLAALQQGPARRRLLLEALVRLTRAWPPTYQHVVAVTSAAGRWNPPGFHRLVELVLDYCFLLGARRARGRTTRPGGALS